jgi:hypothetical protein
LGQADRREGPNALFDFRWSGARGSAIIEHMFDDDVVVLTQSEYDAYIIARLETEFDADCPDPADFVTDEHQRFLDSRARLLTAGAAHLDVAVAADREVSRAAASRARALAAFARSRPAAMFDRAPGERGGASAAPPDPDIPF